MFTECLLGVSGLELPLDRPETDTDMDMDIEVDVDTDATLLVLSQSLDLALLLALIFGLMEHRSAASASLDVPVNVDTGLVFVDVSICASRLVKLLNEAAELSCPCIGACEEHASGSAFAFVRPDPNNKPNFMYKSDCDDFLVFEDNGFTQPPSSSVEISRTVDYGITGVTYRYKNNQIKFNENATCYVLKNQRKKITLY